MARGLIPVVALLTVGVLGAWFLAPHRPRPLPPQPTVPAAGDEPAATSPPPGVPPTARAVAPAAGAPAAPAAPPDTLDHLPSPFARETMPHHLDAIREAALLLKAGKPNEAAQLLVNRANQADGLESDRLRAAAARIYVDLDRAEEARAILKGGPSTPSQEGEFKALDAKLNRKRYLPPRIN